MLLIPVPRLPLQSRSVSLQHRFYPCHGIRICFRLVTIVFLQQLGHLFVDTFLKIILALRVPGAYPGRIQGVEIIQGVIGSDEAAVIGINPFQGDGGRPR